MSGTEANMQTADSRAPLCGGADGAEAEALQAAQHAQLRADQGPGGGFVAQRYERLDASEGMYGIVHRCIDHQRQTVVAIKRLKMVGSFAQFVREMAILQRMTQHANIVKVLDLRPRPGPEGKADIVMEHAPLNLYSLASLFSMRECRCARLFSLNNFSPFPGGSRLPLPLVRSITRQLLSAVSHVHARNVYHRDLKPENILVRIIPIKKQNMSGQQLAAPAIPPNINDMANSDAARIIRGAIAKWVQAALGRVDINVGGLGAKLACEITPLPPSAFADVDATLDFPFSVQVKVCDFGSARLGATEYLSTEATEALWRKEELREKKEKEANAPPPSTAAAPPPPAAAAATTAGAHVNEWGQPSLSVPFGDSNSASSATTVATPVPQQWHEEAETPALFPEMAVFSGAPRPLTADHIMTPCYRAPEIVFRNTTYGPGVDVFSVGCIVAELVLGDMLMWWSQRDRSHWGEMMSLFRTLGTPSVETLAALCPKGRDSFPVMYAREGPQFPCRLRKTNGAFSDAPPLREDGTREEGLLPRVLGEAGVVMIEQMLQLLPENRPSAATLLKDYWSSFLAPGRE